MRYLTIALAKGRLARLSVEILLELGYNCSEILDKTTRKLIFTDEEHKLKFILVKASDVPTYVEYGAADIGIVGRDTILEEGRNVYEMVDLMFGKCRMCVCGPKALAGHLGDHTPLRVASKYPNIAKDYFESKDIAIELIKLSGSIELAPLTSLSDVIVDIVETGTTLRENGLDVLEEICPLSARIIVNRVSAKTERDRIKSIVYAMKQKVHKEEV